MNNFKPASKLRIFAIISCALIIIGIVLGTVFHFVSNGFFNYDGEYSSYKSVTIPYLVIEIETKDEQLDLETICDEAFKNANVTYYFKNKDANATNNKQLEYRFNSSTDVEALNAAKDEINSKIAALKVFSGGIQPTSRADVHDYQTILGGEHAISMAAIVIAAIVLVHCVYVMMRYRLSAAFTAIAVDLHNIALFAALLALCRVPVSSTVMVFAILLTLATAIGVTYMLERIKRNANEYANLSVAEVTNLSAGQTLKANVALPAFLAIAAILLFVVMAVSTMSVMTVLVPALLAIIGFVVTIYGTVMFAPAIYCFIKSIVKKITSKPSQKKGN